MSNEQKTLKGKTLFITGSSRGIGLAIALRAARDGANIVIAAKTETANPKLPGTIYSAADEVRNNGGQALPVVCDIRSEELVAAAFDAALKAFGGIDILVNNASAISLTPTVDTDLKRYRLMHEINVGGTFLCAKHAIEHLKKSRNPHILTMSPPLKHMGAKWLAPYLAYAMSKYGMSMCTLGLAAELAKDGIAANSLWPETLIATAAVRNNFGDENLQGSRKPEIVADAAYAILTRSARECSGNFFTDVEVLGTEGVTDFDQYAFAPGHKLRRDIFLD